jgi:Fic family protein
MILFPTSIIEVDNNKIKQIEDLSKAIYRLIIYSRDHFDDDLLDIYLDGFSDLKDLLSIKNAQMEAQNEEEAVEYLKNLKQSLEFVIEEILHNNDFEKEIQLFQLLRLISPETNKIHPNKYRQTTVQIGSHICPEPQLIPGLISQLFFNCSQIDSPILQAIYFHHELIRIHPFVDGNGRVTRIAKNWTLMYNMYPPIFINDATEKKEYIHTLSNSFKELSKDALAWNVYTKLFFDQELNRLIYNLNLLYESINTIGTARKKNLNKPFGCQSEFE